eukprot:NODE_17_length_48642_cov_1.199349.p22 type:complete len:284 gc:universal NODE_17_length_48642_cov_1.199349:40343-39492(-)
MMKVMPRTFRYLSDSHCILIIKSLLKSLQFSALIVTWDQVQNSLHAINEYLSGLASKIENLPNYLESHFNTVLEYLQNFDIWQSTAFNVIQNTIMDMEWEDLTECLEILLNGLTLSAVVRTSSGILILTAILSRAEVLKTSEKNNQKFDLLFNEMYQQIKLYVAIAFPPQYVYFPDPKILSHFTNSLSCEDYVLKLTNDSFIWQFLAAMVISADAEIQTEIVSEVRDRVMWNASAEKDASFTVGQSLRYTYTPAKDFNKVASSRAVANVNIFLHSLGFDSSQL